MMKKIFNSRIFILTSCLIALTVSTALIADDKGPANSFHVSQKIVKANVGEHVYFVPKAYMTVGSSGIYPENISLWAFYPGSAIVPGDSTELWRQGEWWKNVSIFLSYSPNSSINFNDFAVGVTEGLGATKYLGEVHGLFHMTQPEEGIADLDDVWFEKKNDQIVSYIKCSEKTIKTDVPQCYQTFRLSQKVRIKITYNKRLLPKWKIIEQNVRAMFTSFETYEASQQFLNERIHELKNNIVK